MTSSTDQQQPPPPPPSSSSSITDWNSIVGKNVKTVDYQDAGKIIGAAENEETIVISYEGPHSTYNYRVPKNRIQGITGPDLLLSIARAELAEYEISDIQDYAAQLRSIQKTEKKEGGEEEEIIVPVIEEKLNVSKKIITDEVIIIKEPVTETKTIEVSVMHEEIDIEKRAASEGNTNTFEKPPPKNTRTEIRVPLIHEEVKIKKEPYVKEEIVIRKKPRTETKTVSEFVTKEKVVTSNNNSNTIGQMS
jgi:uncharacterized protein (TIGR02271 family)